MPATCGWHPWWCRDLAIGGALELDLDLEVLWERDPTGIPTGRQLPVGRRPAEGWDDCFTVGSRPPELHWPGAVSVVMTSDCPQVVVYDQPAHAACVEPQTAPPDAFHLGCDVIEPGRPLVATTSWSWKLG
jgi:aldose 1-epimerase